MAQVTSPLKIAVVCANGNAGTLIVNEAIGRGHDVTAVVRGENKTAAPHALVKDVFDLTANDLAGFDCVIDAFGAWTPDTIPGITAAAKRLADLLEGTDVRLLVVGGAGSLIVDASTGLTLDATPDFPEDWKPLSAAHGDALADLRSRANLAWTYVSPAADFQATGERTGSYQLAGDLFTLSAAGASTLSYADYAIAMLDLIESGEHVGERVSVVSK